MAGIFDSILSTLRGSDTSTAENPKLLPGGQSNFFQLFAGAPKEQPTTPFPGGHPSNVSTTADGAETGAAAGKAQHSFWTSPAGSTVQSLLGSLALGGLGAGIGAIASPGARGLGAARGFGMGADTAINQDIAMRKSAAQAPTNLLADQLTANQQRISESQSTPDYTAWLKGFTSDPNFAKKYPDFNSYYQDAVNRKFQLTPYQQGQLGLGQKKIDLEQQKIDKPSKDEIKQQQAIQEQTGDESEFLRHHAASKQLLDTIPAGYAGKFEELKSKYLKGSLTPEEAKTYNAIAEYNSGLHQQAGILIKSQEGRNNQLTYQKYLENVMPRVDQGVDQRAGSFKGLEDEALHVFNQKRAKLGLPLLNSIDDISKGSTLPQQSTMTPEDRQYLGWAQSHPNDPTAQQILQHWGAK